MRKVATILTALLYSLGCIAQLQRIPLSAGDAYANQHKKDDFSKLSDGDLTTHFTVWSPQITPYRVTYDMSGYDNLIIKQIRYFVNNGNPSQLKYIIRTTTGEEKILYSYSGGNWNPNWVTIDLPNTTAAKDFIIESIGNGDFPDDLQLYGTYTLHQWPSVTRQASPLSDLFGVVIKPWDDEFHLFPEKLPALLGLRVSRARLYNDYQLNHKADGSWNMNQQDGWRQVDNMKTLKANGISTQMCYLSFPYEPFPTGEVRNDPATYLQLAKDVYDFGVDNKANGEYFKTIEVGNEMNRWYASNWAEYMDGYALAAMMSICYDGHKGKFTGVGLKASGSQAQVSLCGLAEAEPYILYQIAEWSEKNRGYRADGTIDLPFDIYSFHLYSSLEGQRQGIPGGVSPEYGMAQYERRLNEIRNKKFSWLKIHIGEWGWDIYYKSALNAPAFGNYTAHQVSGMWSARAILWMAANRIDADSYYRIAQDYNADDLNEIPFSTMALLRTWNEGGIKQPDGSYTGFDIRRTLTGDYLSQLSALLSDGWTFESQVSTSPIVLKFKKGTQELYAIWEVEDMIVTDRPQFTEKTGTYNLNVKGKIKRFTDNGSGVMSEESFNGGQISYSAKPLFVVVEPTQTPLPIHLISFTAEKVNQSAILRWVVEDADKVEVERSSDGRTWTNLGEGIFNKLIDPHPAFGKNYYRLKMYEPGGSFTYSQVRVVAIKGVHARVNLYNVVGQLLKSGWSEDVEGWKSEISLPGKYFLEYRLDGSRYTETFIR
jgi:hypothetical protein